MLTDNGLEELVSRIRPDRVERIWVEPYNDRKNWKAVRDEYAIGSPGYNKITELYGSGKKAPRSAYATELYVRLRDKARSEGWLKKLCYLLYEDRITESDARHFRGLKGVLLQSKPGEDGKSRNPAFARMQRP
ncbi:MAG: hypothetical protein IT428_08405 [Planctomycetaceae bacterium]|nr:hypothetical protein [Planctomycetaceae bacterium]